MDMKQLRLVLVAAGLVAVVGGGLILRSRRAAPPPIPVADDGSHAISPLQGTPASIVAEQERIAQLVREDKEHLVSGHATVAEIYGAMVRLAQRGDPMARQEAVAKSKHPNRVIREGAANALGYFDDEESLGILRSMVDDKEISVRTMAIQAIGRVKSPARRQALHELLRRSDLTAEERVSAHTSLVQIADSADSRRAAIDEVVRLAKSGSDERASIRAVQEVVALAPRDPRVLELLRDVLVRNRLKAVQGLAVRHLSVVADPWMRRNMKQYLESEDRQMRMAVVQTLHSSCPADRWTLLDKVIQHDRDRGVVQAALREIDFMPGRDAVALLERLLLSHALEGKELESAKASLEQLKKSVDVDPCLGFKE